MTDYIVRATAAGAQIRAFACTGAETVETARRLHNTSPVVTAALGRLLCAGAMMGTMLKGERDILTLQIKADGPVQGLTVTADSGGNVKGYAQSGAVGQGMLSVIKDMGLKEPYSGQTLLQTGEIAEDLTYYFATSEQTPSSVGLGVLMNRENTVRQAGGFIVQLMPFAEEAVIDRLEQNLKQIRSVTELLDGGSTPWQMLERVLEGLEPEMTDTVPMAFSCSCSREKIEKVLVSLGRDELDQMIQEGQEIEVNCHFCNRQYKFSVDQLKELYQRSRS